MDNNIPQDLQAAQRAFPVEQAEVRADPFTGANHASLPGVPANEPYMIGNELNRAEQGQFSQGVNLGGLDAQNLYSTANPFPDQQPAYATMGYPSQQGIVTGAIQVSLSGSDMYVSPIGNLPVGFHEMAHTNPEIAGESMTTTE